MSAPRSGMRRLWIVGAFAAALLALAVPYASAVHDEGLFELDANAFDEAAAGDDWDTLVGGGGSANLFNMTQDPVESPADDIFDGGQSKDTSDIDAWSWKGAEPNDKNDIQHAFAAAYEDPDNGHLIVYFGLDRLDSSGDAAAGFWFLKRPVEQVTIDGKNVFVYKGTNTLAEHSVGDVLVQSDFTNGGVVERIDSYGWGVAPAGSQVQPGSPLRLIAEGADCDDDAEPPELCGQVNDGGEDVPANWPGSVNPAGSVKFKAPGGVVDSTVFNDATFLEGGIDLTSLFGRNVCTAQFIAETRQSQSETAVLEDKVEGDFELCDIEVTKSGPEKSKVGDDATYEVEVKNTGAVTLFKQSIEDTLAGDLTDGTNPAIVDSTCGESLAPDETCTIEYTYTVQAGDPDPLPNTVDVEYNRDEELTGDSVTDSASHEVNLFQPSITFEKTGDDLSKIGDKVDYTLTLNNTSSADSPDLECTISDPTVGVDEDVTLASGASEVIDVTDFEIPAGADDPFPNTATATCSPQGFPNVLEASDGHAVNLFQPSITFEKTGDDLSKIGDKVDYTLTLNNTSSADSPDLECTISDPTVGVDEDVTLASGASEVIDVTDFEIPAGADDPFPNTATATCSPQGFPNVLEASDGHAVNLFQPSITFEKTGDALSKIGDKVDYTLTLNNTSSADSPDLECTISDPTVGVDEDVTLASGASEVIDVTDFEIPAGADDPFPNTATATCSPQGFPNVLEASDGHEVNLFQPSITFEKTGDALSKIGDKVDYTLTLNNTSSADSPDLECTISDPTVGVDEDVTLASGASEVIDVTDFEIPAGADDPFPNTATATCSPQGFPNVLEASDGHEVNLFQPSITFEKTGDDLSKIGDKVDYTLTLNNTSSADSPDLECTISDPTVGVDEDVTLASGASEVIDVTDFEIPAGADDPFPNTATATCSPQGFPNVLEASDGHAVNLFQPSITVEKQAGNPFSKAGDDVTYTVKISNTSSADSPDLVIESIDDSLQGDLTDPGNVDSSDCGPSLASATSCTIEYTRTVVAGDPEILTNTVSVKTHPDGFANDIDASDAVDVDILHPSYTVAKDCKSGTEPVPQQGPAVFTVTITNTGDADLVITADDGIGQVSLAAGATMSFTVTINGPFSGQSTVENTVTTSAVLGAQYGLPNTLQGNATGDCRVGSRVKVKKLTSGVVNPSQNWTFQLFNAGPHGDDSDSSFLGSPLATATTLGDGDGVLDFGNINLDPTKTYTLCERDVPSGWTVIWKVDTNGDGTPDTTVSPFNPNSKDVPPADLGNRCFDFGAGTGYPLPAGGTLAFEINNTRPGGQPRTIGYWKNWSSCTGGNQVRTAAKNGGVAAGFFLLDDVLPITIGSYTIPAANTVESGTNKTGCQIAVLLLGKSDKKTGKNMANDAAYGLAAQLIAAKANLKAGAVNCPALTTAIASADSLLTSINFTGTGEYLGPKVKGALATTRTQALSLAATLDQYNNGNLC